MTRSPLLVWQNGSAGQLLLKCESPIASTEKSAIDHRVREVFLTWREPLYRYLLPVAGSAGDAEDLTQETFIRLFLHLRKGHQIDNLRAWLFRVAHNLAVDLNRRPDRGWTGSQDFLQQVETHCDPQPDVERNILVREEQQRLLASLSPQERRCMELRTEGLRYREIAEVLGIRIPTVQTILGRAVQKLSSELHGYRTT